MYNEYPNTKRQINITSQSKNSSAFECSIFFFDSNHSMNNKLVFSFLNLYYLFETALLLSIKLYFLVLSLFSPSLKIIFSLKFFFSLHNILEYISYLYIDLSRSSFEFVFASILNFYFLSKSIFSREN